MGASISTIYQSENAIDKVEETSDDEFLDAVDDIETVDNMIASTEIQEHLMTDAVESKYSHFHINTSKITYENVAAIENKLDIYEKISLIFLLIDHADLALQYSLSEMSHVKRGTSNNVLSQWARSKDTSSSTWQDKFVEALCVIQNYAAIRELGFSRDELITHYLPSQPYTSIHLNLLRKALYCLCEQLSIFETKKLLRSLFADFKIKSFKFPNLDENYLELFLLQCFSVKYITDSNISNLVSVLKQSGLLQKAEMLESVLNLTTRVTRSQKTEILEKSTTSNEKRNENNSNFDLTKRTENYASSSQITCSDNSVIGENSIVKLVSTTPVYNIDPKNVGICLIINQKKFYKRKLKSLEEEMIGLLMPKHDLKERHGSDIDKNALSKTFQEFGFRIETFDNLDHDSVIPNIEATMQKFSEKDSCFIICILSHGIENNIYGADSLPVSIDDIINTLHDRKYKFLLGKPKVLIIQSCQGTDLQEVVLRSQIPRGITTDGPNNDEFNYIHDASGIPERCDLLICMSTIPGFASIRHEAEGSWYIQELCKVIDENCEEEHLSDILTIVTNRVTSKYWNKAKSGIVTMVPEARNRLSKKLFFKNLRKPKI